MIPFQKRLFGTVILQIFGVVLFLVFSVVKGFRGGLPLSDISENPNNDRIDGDPPTHPPNPNNYLMLEVMYIGRYTQPLLFMEYGCFEKRILSALLSQTK